MRLTALNWSVLGNNLSAWNVDDIGCVASFAIEIVERTCRPEAWL